MKLHSTSQTIGRAIGRCGTITQIRLLGPSAIWLSAIRLIVLLIGLSNAPRCLADSPEKLWVYSTCNFQVDKDVDRLAGVIERAGKAGYNGAVITDFKFGNFDDRPDSFFKNLQRIKQVATQNRVELIPCVMPVGYSNSVLQRDPNMAAALPVKDCEMVVKGGVIVPVNPLVFECGFEQSKRNGVEPWDYVDGWQKSSSLDANQTHSGKTSIKLSNFRQGERSGNARLMKTVKLQPFQQYRISFWTKAAGLDANLIQFMPRAGERQLSFSDMSLKPDHDWTQHHFVFNTLEHSDVRIYLGVWGGNQGSLWIDDVKLQKVVGVNLVKRDGCPIRLTSMDKKTVYREGQGFRDYRDEQMGVVPYGGEYIQSQAEPFLRQTLQSEIKQGQRVLLSYYHTMIVHQYQVSGSLAHPKTFDWYRDQVAAFKKYWQPKTYFMQHDEIRVGGYDELAKGRTTGELLAENVKKCTQIIREMDAEAEIIVWSDMFDPYHNAVDGYYLTKQTMKGSWEGLTKDVMIANWNNGASADSIKWFADRKHSQVIAGYYDQDLSKNVERWKRASETIGGIRGWMYTTWTGDHSKLEEFAKAVSR